MSAVITMAQLIGRHLAQDKNAIENLYGLQQRLGEPAVEFSPGNIRDFWLDLLKTYALLQAQREKHFLAKDDGTIMKWRTIVNMQLAARDGLKHELGLTDEALQRIETACAAEASALLEQVLTDRINLERELRALAREEHFATSMGSLDLWRRHTRQVEQTFNNPACKELADNGWNDFLTSNPALLAAPAFLREDLRSCFDRMLLNYLRYHDMTIGESLVVEADQNLFGIAQCDHAATQLIQETTGFLHMAPAYDSLDVAYNTAGELAIHAFDAAFTIYAGIISPGCIRQQESPKRDYGADDAMRYLEQLHETSTRLM